MAYYKPVNNNIYLLSGLISSSNDLNLISLNQFTIRFNPVESLFIKKMKNILRS